MTLALPVAVVSAIYALFFFPVPVDDRGEPLPTQFRGVAEQAREVVTGEPLPDRTSSFFEVTGPGAVLSLLIPVLVAGFAVWASRQPNRSRLLTIAMLVMAVATLFTGVGLFFFPALILLAVGSFQARRAEIPARAAERVAPGDGDAIDTTSEEVTGDAEADDVFDDDELVDDAYDEDIEIEDEDELVDDAYDEDIEDIEEEDIEDEDVEGEDDEIEGEVAEGEDDEIEGEDVEDEDVEGEAAGSASTKEEPPRR